MRKQIYFNIYKDEMKIPWITIVEFKKKIFDYVQYVYENDIGDYLHLTNTSVHYSKL